MYTTSMYAIPGNRLRRNRRWRLDGSPKNEDEKVV